MLELGSQLVYELDPLKPVVILFHIRPTPIED